MQIDLQLSPESIEAIRAAVHEEIKTLTTLQSDNTMTIDEVASFMKVSTGTIRSYLKKGMPHFQSGQVIRFLRADVISWMRQRNEEGEW